MITKDKVKRILIIKGNTQYGVLDSVCDEFLTSFCDMGYVVSMLNLGNFRYDLYSDNLFSNFDLILSFDGMGIDLYNQMSVKPFFWMYLVDHPFYLNERLKKAGNNVMVSCVDRRHVDYIDKYYKEISWTCFMPHGGLTGNILPIIPYKDRTYNVSLIASLGNFESINPLIQSLRNEYDAVSNPVIENALLDLDTDLEFLVHKQLTKLNIDFDELVFRDLMYVFRPIDALRRYYKRTSIIKDLCKNGVSINIWGNGWEQFTADNHLENMVILHGNAEYADVKNIMRNSKILLNDMPLFHDGSHERVFAAMQSGAVVATDRSLFLEECFTEKKDILFYDNDHIDFLADTINELLNYPQKAQHIIDNSLVSSKNHTWKNRASDIIDIINGLIK